MPKFCLIADALYGEGSEEAQAARVWVSEGWQGEEAEEFREWYAAHGQDVAEALKHDPEFKAAHEAMYRELFDDFVERGRKVERKMKRRLKKSTTSIHGIS
jgi:hypothetical protein